MVRKTQGPHKNKKEHPERAPLDSDVWTNMNPAEHALPAEAGVFNTNPKPIDEGKHFKETVNWNAFYDTKAERHGAPTDASIRAMVTFPKPSEKLGRQPSGLAHVGVHTGKRLSRIPI